MNVSFEFPFDLEFESAERELGANFVREGSIELTTTGEDGFFEAEVRVFNRRIFVFIQNPRDGKPAEHGCECAHFDNTGTGCEHLWALRQLLENPETEVDDSDDTAEILPHYLILPNASEKEAAIVLSLFDDRGRTLSLSHEVWADIHEDADVEAMRILATAAGGWQDVKRGGGFVRPRPPWTLDSELARRLLPILASTGRLHAGAEPGSGCRPLAAEIGGSLQLALAAVGSGDGKIEIEGRLVSADDQWPLADLDLALAQPESWCLIEDRLHPVDCFRAQAWIRTLRRGRRLGMSEHRVDAFLVEMEESHALPRLTLPATEPDLLPLLDVAPRGRVELVTESAKASLNLGWIYGAAAAIGDAHGGALVFSPDEGVQYRRDEDAELAGLRRLLDAGAEPDPEEADRYWLDAASIPEILNELIEREFTVFVENRPLVRARSRPVTIRSGADWFELDGGLEVSGEIVPLARVLGSVSANRSWVELDTGAMALLPAGDRAQWSRLAPLSVFGKDEKGRLRLSPAQSLLADELTRDLGIPADAGFAELRDRFAAFDGVEPVSSPCGLNGELRPYQSDGLAWMVFLSDLGLGGCLADEMGLGKTIQVIAEILRRNEQDPRAPHLVVVPRSLLHNWQDEISRFAPSVDVHEYAGPRRSLEGVQAGMVVLTTYGVLRRDAESLAEARFDLVVLDEAQAIKNRSSATAAAARGLNASGRLALSGTPIENRIDELWSLMEFLNPGLLGHAPGFASLMRAPDDAARAGLRRAIRPVLLRRTKNEVAKDLPDLIEQTLVCDMSAAQSSLYDRLRLAVKAQVEGKALEPGTTCPRPRSPAATPAGRLSSPARGREFRRRIGQGRPADRKAHRSPGVRSKIPGLQPVHFPARHRPRTTRPGGHSLRLPGRIDEGPQETGGGLSKRPGLPRFPHLLASRWHGPESHRRR